MSTTRLVVLGAVRVFQPVHGYFLRRELMTWQVDEWANINPGSIYNALRTLTREGFLEEVDTEAEGARPARTTYRLTGNGEDEFFVLLRQALWTVETFDPTPVHASLSFMCALTRREVIDAFEHRVSEIDAKILASGYAIEAVLASDTTPHFVREMFDITTSRLRGEQDWARQLIKRLQDGAYVFSDEPGYGDPPRDRPGSPPYPAGRPPEGRRPSS
jgi:DNA-binding PadR family transcriptional regulator